MLNFCLILLIYLEINLHPPLVLIQYLQFILIYLYQLVYQLLKEILPFKFIF